MKSIKIALQSISILIFLFVLGCKNSTNYLNINEGSKKADSIEGKIIGKWGGDDRKVPIFIFTKDSFFNSRDNEGSPYNIVNGNLILWNNKDSINFMKNIRISNDTLFFYIELNEKVKNFEVKGFRIRE